MPFVQNVEWHDIISILLRVGRSLKSGDKFKVQGLNLGVDEILASVQTGPGTHLSLLYNGYLVILGVRWLGRCVNHPRPSGAEVKESVKLYFYFPCTPLWRIIGWTFPFTYLKWLLQKCVCFFCNFCEIRVNIILLVVSTLREWFHPLGLFFCWNVYFFTCPIHATHPPPYIFLPVWVLNLYADHWYFRLSILITTNIKK